MRRGLMAWDANEIPLETLAARLGRLRAAMAVNGEDALLLYTNFIRPGAVCWLTAFSPYWADGILMVPREGEPVFATTLSNRVASWVQSVKPVGALLHSPYPGTALAARMKQDGAKRVAILELDAFPGGVYDELEAGLDGVDIVEGAASFAAARAVPDAAERGVLRHADAIARAALALLDPATMPHAGAAVGAVEQHARLAGAEEAYIAIAPDLDNDLRFIRVSGGRELGTRFAVRATIAYKGSWVRRIRSCARDAAEAATMAQAENWLDALAQAIDPAQPLGPQIAAALPNLPNATLKTWIAEAVLGTNPLAVIATPLSDTATMPARVLTIRLNLGNMPWWGASLLAH